MLDDTTTPATLGERVLTREGCLIHYWLGRPDDAPLVVLMHGATMDHRITNEKLLEFLGLHIG